MHRKREEGGGDPRVTTRDLPKKKVPPNRTEKENKKGFEFRPLEDRGHLCPNKTREREGFAKKNLHTDCLAEGLGSGAAGEDRRGVLWGDGGGEEDSKSRGRGLKRSGLPHELILFKKCGKLLTGTLLNTEQKYYGKYTCLGLTRKYIVFRLKMANLEVVQKKYREDQKDPLFSQRRAAIKPKKL